MPDSSWLRARDSLLSILFPSFCKICGHLITQNHDACICGECWDGVLRIGPPLCYVCGLPLPGESAEAKALRCGECLFERYPLRAARAAAYYEQTMREAIHLFKFDRRRNLAHRLVDLLYQTYMDHRPALLADMLVAVPLHRDRLRERGFNQSEWLAQRLARRTGLRCESGVLQRARATLSQSGLQKKARAKNVRRAFVASRPEKIRNQAVLLIDDVFTTGATLSECAVTLLAAGARSVCALTVARVV